MVLSSGVDLRCSLCLRFSKVRGKCGKNCEWPRKCVDKRRLTLVHTLPRTHVASVHRMIMKKILLKLGLGVKEVAFGGQVRRVFLNRVFGASHAPSYSPYVGFLKILCLLIFQVLQKIKDAEAMRTGTLKAIFLTTDLEDPNAWEVLARSAYEKCFCM